MQAHDIRLLKTRRFIAGGALLALGVAAAPWVGAQSAPEPPPRPSILGMAVASDLTPSVLQVPVVTSPASAPAGRAQSADVSDRRPHAKYRAPRGG